MPMYQFGSGELAAVPIGTYATANPTPRRFGTLQEVSVNFNTSQKELFGKRRMPIAVAATEVKIEGTAKNAAFSAALFNAIFIGGGAPAAGGKAVVWDEELTPTSNAVTASKGADVEIDLGCYNTVSKLFMTQVASAPGAGQYSVNLDTGVYTFASGFADKVQISYMYAVAASGITVPITNLPMGSNPQFQIILENSQYQSKKLIFHLLQCGASKMTFGWKNNDWSIPDFGFYAMDDGTGKVGYIYADE